MPLDDIIRKIGEDARAEADSLLSVARAEAEGIVQKAQKEAEALRAELKQKSEKRAEEHANRIKILAGLEERKDILREKKRLIDDAFAKAEERIRSFAPEEQRQFLKPLVLGAVESGNEEIIPPASQREIYTKAFLDSINKELGARGNLRLSEENGEFAGGFILREGKKEVNQTLKSLINHYSDRLEPQIAAILFGQ